MFRNTVEQNRKVLESKVWKSEDELALVESLKSGLGIDIREASQFPVTDPSFSFKKVKAKLAEADSLSLFPQVLRAGVQSVVNSMYSTVETSFEQWTQTVSSARIEELYAPLHGVGFPGSIGEQEVYPEVGAAGLDLKLRNKKFGTLFPVSRELMEDDQTGQFQKMSGLLGAYAKQVLEVLAYGKLASISGGVTYGNITVPPTETKPASEAVYPWSTSLIGGGATRPASYAVLSQPVIQNAFIALMNQKNLLGLKMSVQPDTLICSPKYRFDLNVLLNSAFYPTGASAGQTGGAFSINPLEGIARPVVSRFMADANGFTGNTTAWALVDSKVPWFVVQVREAAVVEVENPASGQSFDRDVVRFKVRTRANADFIDPRFAFLGNDGTAV